MKATLKLKQKSYENCECEIDAESKWLEITLGLIFTDKNFHLVDDSV